MADFAPTPKKISSFTAKNAYDDVFGGASKHGIPTFSSRVEDYIDIFSTRNSSSRISSIPFLDLPVVDETAFGNDVWSSSEFDYSEIFGGGFDSVDYAVPYEELFLQPKSGSPAGIVSPPEESSGDPVCSESNEAFSNIESHYAYDCRKQFNMSYLKTNQVSKEDGISGATHIAQLIAIPAYTFVVDENLPVHTTKCDNSLPEVANHQSLNGNITGLRMDGKHFGETMPPQLACGSAQKSQKNFDGKGTYNDNPFPTLPEISFKTHPTEVPPPSRQPPNLIIKQGSRKMLPPDLKSSTKYARQAATRDSSPSFDVDVDSSSSAAASVAAMKEAMEIAQARMKSAKELRERKKDGLQNRKKMGMKDTEGTDVEESQKGMRVANVAPELQVNPELLSKESVNLMYLKERRLTQASEQEDIIGEWKAEELFYELVKKDTVGKVVAPKHKKSESNSVLTTSAYEHGQKERLAFVQQEENYERLHATKTVCESVDKKRPNVVIETYEKVDHEEKIRAGQRLLDYEQHERRQKESHELKESEKKRVQEEHEQKLNETREQKRNQTREREEHERKLKEVHEQEDYERRLKETLEREEKMKEALRTENETQQREAHERVEKERKQKACERRQKEAREKEENGNIEKEKIQEAFQRGENERRRKEAREIEENEKRLKESYERQEKERRLKQAAEEYERRQKQVLEMEENQRRQKELHEKEENEKIQEAFQMEENERRQQEACEIEENEKRLKESYERQEKVRRLKQAAEEDERRLKQVLEMEEIQRRQKEHESKENEKRLKESHEREENERKLRQVAEESERRLQEVIEREKNERRQKEEHEREENEKRLKDSFEREEKELKLKQAAEEDARGLKEVLEMEENQRKQKELEREENQKRLKECHEREENERKLKQTAEENEMRLHEVIESEKNERRQIEAHKREESDKRLKESSEKGDNKWKLKQATEGYQRSVIEVHEQEENEKRRNGIHGQEDNERSLKEHCMDPVTEKLLQEETCESVENAKKLRDLQELNESKMRPEESHKWGKNDKKLEEASGQEEIQERRNKDFEGEENDQHELSQGLHVCNEDKNLKTDTISEERAQDEDKLKVGNDACMQDETKRPKVTHGHKQEANNEKLNTARGSFENVNDEKLRAANLVQSASDHEECKDGQICASMTKVDDSEKKLGQSEDTVTVKEDLVALDCKDGKISIKASQRVGQCSGDGTKFEAVQLTNEEEKRIKPKLVNEINTNLERKKNNLNGNVAMEVSVKEGRILKDREQEKERLRKLEEHKEREKEREKDRIAVERVTREARERAFTEARERAERAAVERATGEARQRAMIEARERLEKACAEAREKALVEKACTESRLRAERAAVERATAEARERAVEKAMAERAAMEARERVERSVSQKFSAASRDGGLKQTTSFSDIHNAQFQNSSTFSSSQKYPTSSNHVASNEKSQGTEVESAQRCKARLERHQRTVERSVKALAEKNLRDNLAQRELAEKNRLGEILDADVKRWSSGKEGKLRALLSTLQYILGSESGWQPIPLTDIVTAVAVKKAYRKATLCVHPDKLQQRGASIQQKYVCEKVFDLLKDAWTKFNSEER